MFTQEELSQSPSLVPSQPHTAMPRPPLRPTGEHTGDLIHSRKDGLVKSVLAPEAAWEPLDRELGLQTLGFSLEVEGEWFLGKIFPLVI